MQTPGMQVGRSGKSVDQQRQLPQLSHTCDNEYGYNMCSLLTFIRHNILAAHRAIV